mmetsp:Transcript_7498/g.46100  ORF Transcript_7498/g.46100 Transcript_7498/m.46100 type:complete len:415 (-) Transcript_7498:220-1464(-)
MQLVAADTSVRTRTTREVRTFPRRANVSKVSQVLLQNQTSKCNDAAVSKPHKHCSSWSTKRRRHICQASAASKSEGSAGKPAALKFLSDNFVPLGLISAIVFGAIFPAPGKVAASMGLSKVATCGIFFISGLCLRLQDVGKALSSKAALLYGFAMVLMLTPLVGIAVQSLPIQPAEFRMGLALFCCMPTSLTSAVTLTTAAGGNAVLALALTIGTNFIGIFTVPFMLSTVMGNLHTSPVAVRPLIFSLVSTVLAPLLAGVVVRASAATVAEWADKNKKKLSYLSNSLLITTPWQQVSKSSEKLLSVRPEHLLLVVAAGCVLHLFFLVVNMLCVNTVGLGQQEKDASIADRKALILVGSQKTLPVAVTVLQQLGPSFGDAGMVVIPCVVAHLMQVLIDSWVVTRWNAQEARLKAS